MAICSLYKKKAATVKSRKERRGPCSPWGPWEPAISSHSDGSVVLLRHGTGWNTASHGSSSMFASSSGPRTMCYACAECRISSPRALVVWRPKERIPYLLGLSFSDFLVAKFWNRIKILKISKFYIRVQVAKI